jgi:hypothetical protein
MKSNLLLLFVCLFASNVFAQTTVANMDFETWTSAPENLAAPWATLNGLSTVTAPLTTSKTTDSHSGTYAAKLETKLFSGILLSGLAVTGNFSLSIVNPTSSLKPGRPFTGRPDSLTGYTKYTSVAGDSAIVVIMLSKWNTTTNRKDTLGTGVYTIYNTSTSYSRFSVALDYNSTLAPDSIVILSTSSAGGGSTPAVGSVGSTLFIDDFTLVYNPSSILTLDNAIVCYNTNQSVMFSDLFSGSIEVIDLMGRTIFNKTVVDTKQFDFPVQLSGVYVLKLNNFYTKQIYINN